MRIGCLGEGHELLGLMQSIGNYNHEYHLIADHTVWPASSKNESTRLVSVKKLLEYAQTLELDCIIVPPAFEDIAGKSLPVLPVFKHLIKWYVAPGSLVNKRGLLGDDDFELQEVCAYASTCFSGFSPAAKQSNNKRYQATPTVTPHAVPQMKYHMLTYGKRDWMMRKSWKFELRALKDAAVDTIIPANRSLLHREGILRHHLNRKKINIVGKLQIQQIFEKETVDRQGQYRVTMHTTDPSGFEKTFFAHKKRKWMLERGEGVQVNFQKI